MMLATNLGSIFSSSLNIAFPSSTVNVSARSFSNLSGGSACSNIFFRFSGAIFIGAISFKASNASSSICFATSFDGGSIAKICFISLSISCSFRCLNIVTVASSGRRERSIAAFSGPLRLFSFFSSGTIYPVLLIISSDTLIYFLMI